MAERPSDRLPLHYTAGCGSDISDVLDDRGISVHFSVDLDGKIYEYVPVTNVAFHAFEASFVHWGVEHTARRGTCDLTDQQLSVSARLTAGLVELTGRRLGFEIPLRKTDGPELVPGFKDHADGTTSTWNDNGHTDRLYRWTWDRYLSEVRSVLAGEGDEVALTPEQEDAIKFSFGMLKYLRGGPSPSEPGPGRRGWRFARRASEATGEPAATQVSPMAEETVAPGRAGAPTDRRRGGIAEGRCVAEPALARSLHLAFGRDCSPGSRRRLHSGSTPMVGRRNTRCWSSNGRRG